MHMKIKESKGRILFEIINSTLLILIAFVCIAPMIHVLNMSISDPGYVSTKTGIMMIPEGQISLNGFKLIFRNPNILRGYANTLFYVVAGTLISGFITLLAGYVLSRRRIRYRNQLMFIVTFTMLFNGGLIPFYLVVRNMHMIDTPWAVLIPTALSVYNVIIMRTAFISIPDSLEESARLDGAGELVVLFQILLPVVKATFAVIILFYAVGKWNEWFFAAIFFSKRELFPLQLLLREILLQNSTTTITQSTVIMADNLDIYKPLIKYATILVATIPILCVYPFAQKYFATGVMIGSIKG